MRVAYVMTSSGLGGSEQYLVYLLRNLDRRRYEPIVFFHWEGRSLPWVEQVRLLGIRLIPLTLQKTLAGTDPDGQGARKTPSGTEMLVNAARRMWYHMPGGAGTKVLDLFVNALRFRLLFRREAIELVHFNTWEVLGPAPAAFAARVLGIPGRVMTFHNLFQPALHRPWLERRLAEWSLRSLHAIIAVSEAVRASILSRLPHLGPMVRVIHNGVSSSAQGAPSSAGELRALLGCPREVPLVAMIGRLTPEKAPHIFLAAIQQITQRVPQARFALIGDGPLKPTVERQVQELGLQDRVVLRAHIPGIRSQLPEVDILALPSLSEGFPLVCLEAMAAGVPVVASAVGGVPEAIQDGVTGRLVPPGDPAPLAEAITDLLRRPDAARAMGRAAQDHVARHFGIEQMVRDTVSLYAEVLGATAM